MNKYYMWNDDRGISHRFTATGREEAEQIAKDYLRERFGIESVGLIVCGIEGEGFEPGDRVGNQLPNY
jgi:hypothetical protein